MVSVPAGTVYPRACGGTGSGSVYRQSGQGLSPRVRGNLDGGDGLLNNGGSIPARAGEPSSGAT